MSQGERPATSSDPTPGGTTASTWAPGEGADDIVPRHILEALQIPVIVIDPATYRVVYANAAAGIGELTADSRCYGVSHGRIAPCDGAEHPCPLAEVQRTRAPMLCDHQHLNASGGPLPVEVHAVPLLAANGEIRYVVEYCVDRSRLLEAERALRHTEQLSVLGKAAAMVAHEVRGPLAGAQMALEMLSENVDHFDTPTIRECVEQVLATTRRLDAIVTDTLAMARQEPDAPQPVALAPLFESLEAELAPAVAERSIDLATRIGDGADVVSASPDRLRQVLQNLLTNAFDALTDGERSVRLEASPEGPASIRIAVRDTGAGMTREVTERAVEPFFSTKRGGTGLGLALCKQWVEQAGGRFELASAPGNGTTISVVLKRAR